MEKKENQWATIDSMRLSHARMEGRCYSYGVKNVWICTLYLQNPTHMQEVNKHLPFLQHYKEDAWISDADNGIFSMMSLQLIPEGLTDACVILAPVRFWIKLGDCLRFFFFQEDMAFHFSKKLSAQEREEKKMDMLHQLGKPLTLILQYRCTKRKTDREIQRVYADTQKIIKFYHKGGKTGNFTFLQADKSQKKWQKTFPIKDMRFSTVADLPIISFHVEKEKIQEFLKYYNRENGRNLFIFIPAMGLEVIVSDQTFPLIVGQDRMIFFLLNYTYRPYMELL